MASEKQWIPHQSYEHAMHCSLSKIHLPVGITSLYLDYQIISYGTSESKAMIYTPLIYLQATVYDCEAVKSCLRT